MSAARVGCAVGLALLGLAATPAAASAAAPAATVSPISNYQVLDTGPQRVEPNSVKTAQLSCPTGTVAISGGMEVGHTGFGVGAVMSFPATPQTWRLRVSNTTSRSAPFYLSVICATASTASVRHATATALPGAQTVVAVSCPAGTVPLGGGGGVRDSVPLTSINSSAATAAGWQVTVNNGDTAAHAAAAYVVCAGKPGGYQVVSGPVQPVAPQTVAGSYVRCPSGLKALGGGSASTSVSLHSEIEISESVKHVLWQAFQANGSDAEDSIQVQAVCAHAAFPA